MRYSAALLVVALLVSTQAWATYSGPPGSELCLNVLDADGVPACWPLIQTIPNGMVGPAGPAGPAGPQGIPGPQGPPGTGGAGVITCTGTSADFATVQNALNAESGQVTVVGSQDCGSLTSPLGATIINPDVAKTNLVTDGPALVSSASPVYDVKGNANGYQNQRYTGKVNIWGTGGAAGGQIGALLETNFLQLDGWTIHDVGAGIQLGNNAYMTDLESPRIWNTAQGLSCPANVINTGEAIEVHGGTIFNGQTGIENLGGCEFDLYGLTIDNLSVMHIDDQFGVVNAWRTRFEDVVPDSSHLFSGPWVTIGSPGGVSPGWSGYTEVNLFDTQVQLDYPPWEDTHVTPITFIKNNGPTSGVNNGAYPFLYSDGMFTSGFYDSTHAIDASGTPSFTYTGLLQGICMKNMTSGAGGGKRHNMADVGCL